MKAMKKDGFTIREILITIIIIEVALMFILPHINVKTDAGRQVNAGNEEIESIVENKSLDSIIEYMQDDDIKNINTKDIEKYVKSGDAECNDMVKEALAQNGYFEGIGGTDSEIDELLDEYLNTGMKITELSEKLKSMLWTNVNKVDKKNEKN